MIAPAPRKSSALKEGVGKEMEHRGARRRQTDRANHVPQLRERGVSEDALDIILLRRHQCGEQGSQHTDPCNHSLRGRLNSMRKKTRASM